MNTHRVSVFWARYKVVFLLSAIFIFALLVRLVALGTLPANLHEDELLVGYVGRFIMENGRDLYGNMWPLWYFDKFGDYYIIGPFYLSGLSTLIFGVNEFAVRFPAALAGALTIFPMYGLACYFFNSRRVALWASFFVAILPWHIVFSRSSSEAVIGSFFFLSGTFLILRYIRKQTIWSLVLATLFLASSYWIYHPFRVYVPLFLTIIAVGHYLRLRQDKRLAIVFGVLILTFALATFAIGRTPWGAGRFNQTSIFSGASGVEARVTELIYNQRDKDTRVVRLFTNKGIGFSREFASQYLSYLDPGYLFVHGWGAKFLVPDAGMLYGTFGILLLAALLVRSGNLHMRKRDICMYAAFVLASLLPAALSVIDSPNPHRALLFGVLLMPVAAYGLVKLSQMPKSKTVGLIIQAAFVVVILIEFVYFSYQYTHHFDTFNSLQRQDGNKTIVRMMYQNRDIRRIYAPSEATLPLYYLFYARDFAASYIGKFRQDARIDQINNVSFIDESCPLIKALREAKKGDMIINRYHCLEYKKVIPVTERVREVNGQLGYTVYILDQDGSKYVQKLIDQHIIDK